MLKLIVSVPLSFGHMVLIHAKGSYQADSTKLSSPFFGASGHESEADPRCDGLAKHPLRA